MVQRAKTLSGLILQYLGTRWAALGKVGKLLVVGGLLAFAVASLQLGACLFGGCPSARQSPCELRSDEPCPYAAERAAAAERAEDPPCH